MDKCNITDKELAEALEISLERLLEICDEFDADPDDDWELVKGIHFEWGPYKSRVFSPKGAVEICSYLEQNKQERPFHKRFERWLFRRDKRLKGLMVGKQIHEVRSMERQIVFHGGRAFLTSRACRIVLGLGTRQDVIRRTVSQMQRPKDGNTDKESLQLGEDFLEDNERKENWLFSGSGLARVSVRLGTTLTQKHRREWADVVAVYAPKVLAAIEKDEAARDENLKKAMDRVRKQARGRCQVTGRSMSVVKRNLEVHHLFDKKLYPQIADVDLNLIAIDAAIHIHFHQWMGGSHAGCTIEHFEQYIEEFGNSLFPNGNVEQATKVAIRLDKAKKSLRGMI